MREFDLSCRPTEGGSRIRIRTMQWRRSPTRVGSIYSFNALIWSFTGRQCVGCHNRCDGGSRSRRGAYLWCHRIASCSRSRRSISVPSISTQHVRERVRPGLPLSICFTTPERNVGQHGHRRFRDHSICRKAPPTSPTSVSNSLRFMTDGDMWPRSPRARSRRVSIQSCPPAIRYRRKWVSA